MARGELIAFVDDDDTLEKDFTTLVKIMQENDADVCRCSFTRIRGNEKKIFHAAPDKAIDIVLEADVLRRVVYPLYGLLKGAEHLPCITVWSGIYSRKLIGEIRFASGLKFADDMCFNAMVLPGCKKLVLVEKSLYNFYYHTGSGSHRLRQDVWPETERVLEVLREYATRINLPQEVITEGLATHAGNGLLREMYMQVALGYSLRKVHSNVLTMLKNPAFADGVKCSISIGMRTKIRAFLFQHKLYWGAIIFTKLICLRKC